MDSSVTIVRRMNVPHALPTTTYRMEVASTVGRPVPNVPPRAASVVLTHTTIMEGSARYAHHTVPLVRRPASARAAHPSRTPHTLDSAYPVIQS